MWRGVLLIVWCLPVWVLADTPACTLAEASATADAATTAPSSGYLSRDNAFYVGVKQVTQRTLVDVRRPEAYAQWHIPFAINLSAIQLKASQALRHKAIALVGPGADGAALEALAYELKHHGFADVVVLKDGFEAWQLAKRPLVTTQEASHKLGQLNVTQALVEARYQGWLIASTGQKPPLKDYPGQTLMTDQPEAIKEALIRHPEIERIMILSDAEAIDATWLRQLRSQITRPVYYLNNATHLVNAERQRQAKLSEDQRRSTQPKYCGA